ICRVDALISAPHNSGFAMFLKLSALALALALDLCLAPRASLSQEPRLPVSTNEVRLSYAPVVQQVTPAVVNVYAAKTVAVRNPLFDDPIFRRFFGVPGGGGEQVQRSLGSGVLVDAAGLV